MYSKTSFIILLATLAFAQAISIGKPVHHQGVQGTTTRVVKVNPNDGFTLQSGYEGFVASPQKTAVSSTGNNFKWVAPTLAKINKVLKAVLIPLSGLLVIYGAKILTIGAHIAFTMLLGIVGTTAVCTLTPICSFSLSLPGLDILKGKSVREQVAEYARNYITKENMEMVSLMVQSALNKYGTGQPREEEQPVEQEQDFVEDTEAKASN